MQFVKFVISNFFLAELILILFMILLLVYSKVSNYRPGKFDPRQSIRLCEALARRTDIGGIPTTSIQRCVGDDCYA